MKCQIEYQYMVCSFYNNERSRSLGQNVGQFIPQFNFEFETMHMIRISQLQLEQKGSFGQSYSHFISIFNDMSSCVRVHKFKNIAPRKQVKNVKLRLFKLFKKIYVKVFQRNL